MSSISSFSRLPVSIDGAEFDASPEYTSNEVAQAFSNSLAVFSNIFNLRSEDDNPDDSQDVIDKINNGNFNQNMQAALWGGTLYDEDNNAIGVVPGLIPLAKDGLTVDGTTQYMTVEMAHAADQLIQSLKAAGIPIQATANDIPEISITTQHVLNWRNLAVSSDAIRQVLQEGFNIIENSNRSFQALVELIYVKQGNDILSDNLESLEEALSSTKDSLDTLANLQTLHNNITAYGNDQTFEEFAATAYDRIKGGSAASDDPAAFVRGSTSGSEEEKRGITEWGRMYFTAIDPAVAALISDQDRQNFLQYRDELKKQISYLESVTPTDPDTPLPDDLKGQSTLLNQLKDVLNDIETSLTIAGGEGSKDNVTVAMANWILDGYSKENAPSNRTEAFVYSAINALSSGSASDVVLDSYEYSPANPPPDYDGPNPLKIKGHVEGYEGIAEFSIDISFIYHDLLTSLNRAPSQAELTEEINKRLTTFFKEEINLDTASEIKEDSTTVSFGESNFGGKSDGLHLNIFVSPLSGSEPTAEADKFVADAVGQIGNVYTSPQDISIPSFTFDFGDGNPPPPAGQTLTIPLDNPDLEGFNSITIDLNHVYSWAEDPNNPGPVPSQLEIENRVQQLVSDFYNYVSGNSDSTSLSPEISYVNNTATYRLGNEEDNVYAASIQVNVPPNLLPENPSANFVLSTMQEISAQTDLAVPPFTFEFGSDNPVPPAGQTLDIPFQFPDVDGIDHFTADLNTIYDDLLAQDPNNPPTQGQIEQAVQSRLTDFVSRLDNLQGPFNEPPFNPDFNAHAIILDFNPDIPGISLPISIPESIDIDGTSSDFNNFVSDNIVNLFNDMTPLDTGIIPPLTFDFGDGPPLGQTVEVPVGIPDLEGSADTITIDLNRLYESLDAQRGPSDPPITQSDLEGAANDAIEEFLSRLGSEPVPTPPYPSDTVTLQFGDTTESVSAVSLPIVIPSQVANPDTEEFTYTSQSPGEIQRKITAAIAGGQSLNDTQKDSVRRYLYIFEEYYKSAAAILTKLTQLIERIAQGIAR